MSTDPISNPFLTEFKSDLPLRTEVKIDSHLLSSQDIKTSTCLDLGFSNPVASEYLRRNGGYWTSCVWTADECSAAEDYLGESVLQVGVDDELPFEDKQFDVVVLARGHISGDLERDIHLIRECHRVMKTPGYIIVSGDYRRKFTPLSLFGYKSETKYDDKQIFQLMRPGFDVLGTRTYCRFWVQIAQRIFRNSGGVMRGIVYGLASFLDLFLFFTRGYYAVAHGRRKTWREHQVIGRTYGRTIGEAVLH